MLFYIGFYADEKNSQNRRIVLSATNKMKYIIDTIEKLGIKQQLVSFGMTLDKKGYPASLEKISENVYLKQFKTFGRKNIFTKALDIYFSKLQLICYLLKNVKASDTLLVYHSPAYCKEIAFIKKIKKCKLVLEVEEIYGDVSGDKALRKKELALCKRADAFVFPTDMLSSAVNFNNKPYVTIHGTYQVEEDRGCRFDDGKTHIVYAGTFDPRKGGVGAAVGAAEYLSEQYHIHIIGFGSERQKEDIIKSIADTNKKSAATVTYDGLLSGEEYIKFIQSCQIGLSTQNPSGVYNDTSFPSKILSYMANGLRVVSVDIPAVKTSAVGEHLNYYKNQTPKEISNSIMQTKLDDAYNGREIITNLDNDFSKNIKKLLEEIYNA
jgi:glycosyltransferase involved in cell wall biosynthesis